MVSIPADSPVLMGVRCQVRFSELDNRAFTVTRGHQLTQRIDTESRDSDMRLLSADRAVKEKQEYRRTLGSPIPFAKKKKKKARRCSERKNTLQMGRREFRDGTPRSLNAPKRGTKRGSVEAPSVPRSLDHAALSTLLIFDGPTFFLYGSIQSEGG